MKKAHKQEKESNGETLQRSAASQRQTFVTKKRNANAEKEAAAANAEKEVAAEQAREELAAERARNN